MIKMKHTESRGLSTLVLGGIELFNLIWPERVWGRPACCIASLIMLRDGVLSSPIYYQAAIPDNYWYQLPHASSSLSWRVWRLACFIETSLFILSSFYSIFTNGRFLLICQMISTERCRALWGLTYQSHNILEQRILMWRIVLYDIV